MTFRPVKRAPEALNCPISYFALVRNWGAGQRKNHNDVRRVDYGERIPASPTWRIVDLSPTSKITTTPTPSVAFWVIASSVPSQITLPAGAKQVVTVAVVTPGVGGFGEIALRADSLRILLFSISGGLQLLLDLRTLRCGSPMRLTRCSLGIG